MCSELDDLDTALDGDPQCIEPQRKREQVKLKLELLEQRKAHAAQVRARAKWVEKGEKLRPPPPPNLETSRTNAKIMDSIKDASGQSVTSQKDICRFREIILLIYTKSKW